MASTRTPAMSQLSGKRLPKAVWMSIEVKDPNVVEGGGTSGNEKTDPLSRGVAVVHVLICVRRSEIEDQRGVIPLFATASQLGRVAIAVHWGTPTPAP
jgi:hypothetical protein